MKFINRISFIAFIVLCRCAAPEKEVYNDILLDSLTRFNSVDEVIEAFGQENVKILTQRTDRFPGPSCILFPETKNQVVFCWDIAERKWPTKFVIVSLSTNDLDNPDSIGRWKTANGLYLGMTLKEVEKINGESFNFNWKHSRSDGAGTDGDPTGELAGVTLWFEPGFDMELGTFSDDQHAQNANPRVFTIVVHREMFFPSQKEAEVEAGPVKEYEEIPFQIEAETPDEAIAQALDESFAKVFIAEKTDVDLIEHKVFSNNLFLHPDGSCWHRYIAQLLVEHRETKEREYRWYALDGISPGYYQFFGEPLIIPVSMLTDPGIPPETLFDFTPEKVLCTAVGIKTQQGSDEDKAEHLSVYELAEQEWQEIFSINLKAIEPIDPTDKAPEYHEVVRTISWPTELHAEVYVGVKSSTGYKKEHYDWDGRKYVKREE